MVVAFINNRYQIDPEETLRDDGNNSKVQNTFPLMRRNFLRHNPDIDLLSNFRLFRATTKPAYLIARFLAKYDNITDAEDDYSLSDNNENANERLKLFYKDGMKEYDPILLSFNHSSEARRRGKSHIEYKNKYQEIIEENLNFSTQMLNLCKNQKEAKLILSSNLKVTFLICLIDKSIFKFHRMFRPQSRVWDYLYLCLKQPSSLRMSTLFLTTFLRERVF